MNTVSANKPPAAGEFDCDPAVHAVSAWLRQRCGIDYQPHKLALLRSRLQQVVDRQGLGDIDELSRRLSSGSDVGLTNAVVQMASTNHTFFFREPRVLERFPDAIFPHFGQQQSIRIWSAAASTGDEAYSVAILAAEHFGSDEARRRVSILGTDISGRVIAKAEQGTYEGPQIEQMPKGVLPRYFQRSDSDTWTVSSDIRSMCTFRRLNLKSTPWPFRSRFDAVLCRNVLYYFDRADQRAVLEAIYDVTAPGGWLLTSVTETIRDLDTRWQQCGAGVYRSQA